MLPLILQGLASLGSMIGTGATAAASAAPGLIAQGAGMVGSALQNPLVQTLGGSLMGQGQQPQTGQANNLASTVLSPAEEAERKRKEQEALLTRIFSQSYQPQYQNLPVNYPMGGMNYGVR